MKKHMITWNLTLTIVAILSIYLSIAQLIGIVDIQKNKVLLGLDFLVWIVFSSEYLYKLYKAENKKLYLKQNILDSFGLIPIPIIALYSTSNLLYILRLLRLLSFFDEVLDNFKIFAKHKGVSYAIYILLLVVTSASFGIYAVEKGTTVTSLGDAFWWSIVTVSTTGFGDIAPKSVIGRIIATVLMFTGIGVFGVIMSTIGNILLEKPKEDKQVDIQTIDISELTDEQKITVKNFVDFLKNT